MFSPISSRRSPSSHSDLGSSIRSRVSSGLSRTQGGSGPSGQPTGLSEQVAGSTAAAEADRIRQSVMARFQDGFDSSGPSGISGLSGRPNLTGITPPTRPSSLGGMPSPTSPSPTSPSPTSPSQTPPTGTSELSSPTDTSGTTDTSSVPKSGDPQLDQWDSTIAQEAQKWGVPPENLKALIALESGGDPNATQINPQYGNTYGLCQINQAIWGETAAQRGYDLNTPEGQIGFAASLLSDYHKQTGSWDQAHSMYFNPAGTGDSVNGTSNSQYIAKIHEYIDSWK
jgi:hypothetical protein